MSGLAAVYNPPPAMETAMQRPRSGNLTATLVAFGVLELLVNRVFAHLFSSGVALTPAATTHGWRLVGDAGPLLFY